MTTTTEIETCECGVELQNTIETYNAWLGGNFTARCTTAGCKFTCSYWECGCELNHNCRDHMNNPYNVEPNEDGEYVYCDFCEIAVDSIDGVTDGFVVACGNYRGNGCSKYIIESEEQ